MRLFDKKKGLVGYIDAVCPVLMALAQKQVDLVVEWVMINGPRFTFDVFKVFQTKSD